MSSVLNPQPYFYARRYYFITSSKYTAIYDVANDVPKLMLLSPLSQHRLQMYRKLELLALCFMYLVSHWTV